YSEPQTEHRSTSPSLRVRADYSRRSVVPSLTLATGQDDYTIKRKITRARRTISREISTRSPKPSWGTVRTTFATHAAGRRVKAGRLSRSPSAEFVERVAATVQQFAA